jgi:hypothetical protein
MSDKGGQELEAGLVAGCLEGISVPDLLWRISRRGKTGVLSVSYDDTTKRVYIQDGKIIFATSSDPDDRLGECLLRDDIITLDQLQRAASRYRPGKRLGTVLVEIAAITPQDLVNGVVSQVKDIALSLFPLEEGTYRFEEGDLPTQEVITVGMNTEELLLQGIRQVRSFSRVRRSVGPPRTRYRLTARWEEIAAGLGLNEGESTLLRHLNSTGRTVEDLCGDVFLSNFEIYQALWAFKVLGAIEETDRVASAPAAIEGRIDGAGLGPILVTLCRDRQTGVLYFSDSSVDRAIHLLEGRCVFATSSNIDDGLVAHLLRRGVISLRDREETARRLLSNKRVGTILREMGVIDDTDLRDMVRDHLREVVLDSFRWDRGEFAFVPGPLPTEEEITLDMSVEDIVREGLCRVTSWSRVRNGSGEPDSRLVLVGDYLQVLDRMSVGQEEWEVVAALRSPKTVSEVCREMSLGSFRVCQLLWTFRVLGIADVQAVAERDASAAPAGIELEAAIAEPAVPAVFEVVAARAVEPEPDAAAPTVPYGGVDREAEVIEEIATLGTESASDSEAPVGAPPSDTLSGDEAPASMEQLPEDLRFEIDSPHDATQYIPPEVVEASLRLPDDDAFDFEIADPAELSSRLSRFGEEPLDSAGQDTVERTADPGEPPSSPSRDHEVPPDSFADFPIDPAGELALSPPQVEPPAAALGEEPPSADEWRRDEAPSEPEAPSVAQEDPPEVPQEPARAEVAQVVPTPEGKGGNGNGADAWHPPSDLEASITRFNAMQRVIYRSIRSEVGAGATNFVRACGGSLGDRFGEVFAAVELQSDGAWDAGRLRQLLLEHRVERPWDGLKRLLDQEIDKLRIHIGEARANSLQERLESIEV